jgi:hypothetical protein
MKKQKQKTLLERMPTMTAQTHDVLETILIELMVAKHGSDNNLSNELARSQTLCEGLECDELRFVISRLKARFLNERENYFLVKNHRDRLSRDLNESCKIKPRIEVIEVECPSFWRRIFGGG